MTCEDCKYYICKIPWSSGDYCRIQCNYSPSVICTWSTKEKYNKVDKLCVRFTLKYPKFIVKLREEQ